MAMNQPGTDLQRQVANAIHAHWGLFLFEGIMLVILGVAAIILPEVATLAFTLVIGWVWCSSSGRAII